MTKVKDLFHIDYGVNLEFNKMTLSKDGIPFVSRTSTNNGVVGRVKVLDSKEPNPANTISVAGGGSVLESFLQEEPYYSGRDLFYLTPKIEMSKSQMLYYCMILRSNNYKYSYGRQANRTLGDISIPSIESTPEWVSKIKIPKEPSKNPLLIKQVSLNDRQWKWFKYDDVFDIKKGYYNKKPEENIDGAIPFIGAYGSNNGVTSYHTLENIKNSSKTGKDNNHPIQNKIFKANKFITIANNGSSVGTAFYQIKDFTCSHDVNPITIKDEKIKMNSFIALFICTLVHLEKFRWDYGRKWRPSRMPLSKIKLPVTKDGEPDWQFMEYYIKSLPYSSNLKEDKKEQKGLSDVELIAKYESGEINLGKKLKTAINKKLRS